MLSFPDPSVAVLTVRGQIFEPLVARSEGRFWAAHLNTETRKDRPELKRSVSLFPALQALYAVVELRFQPLRPGW